MVPKVPMPPQPVALQSQENHKPWAVALQIDDPEKARKLQLLSATFGKKPGPYLTQVVMDWLDTIDLQQLQQEALPIAEAG